MRGEGLQCSVFGFRTGHLRSEISNLNECRPDRAERVPACSTGAEPPELAGARSGLRLGRPRFVSYQADEAADENAVAAPAKQVAEIETQSFQTTELDLPESTAGILLLFGSLAALIALTVRTSLRDSRFLKKSARATLLVPRLLVLALVLLIVLNPQKRTQLSRVEKSRVGILLDTSLSMAWPASDEGGAGAGGQASAGGTAANGATANVRRVRMRR